MPPWVLCAPQPPGRTGAGRQDACLLAAALGSCARAQCGFVVFGVWLFLQKSTEVCRLSSALPSVRTASLLNGGHAELSWERKPPNGGAKIRGICTELATAARPFPDRADLRLSLSSPHLP